MITWSRKTTWIAGLMIIVLTNVIALAGVAYNRAGEPDGTLVLTERELRLPYSAGSARENSGLSLTIEWRTLQAPRNGYPGYNNRWGAVEWLDETRLDELGFETGVAVMTPESRSRFNRSLSRDVWFVLEYDGPAYQAMRERVKAFSQGEQELARRNPGNEEFEKRAARAKKLGVVERQEASRLFVVDAGLDPAMLRRKYPDEARYSIARGQVGATVNNDDDDSWRVQGYIQSLAVESVNVPLAFRDVFETLAEESPRENEGLPRYSVTLAYGKRQGPWIVSAEKKKH